MHADLTGTTLGKYELRELLGTGGMGAVYRAYDDSLKREVAIKVVNLGMGGAELQARFIREAQTAARLEHSHIVRVYDYGIERDINYVVMQYLNGGSLAERMREAGFQGRSRASLTEVALLLEHLASALDYAHTQGVIHRDIKPQNIMFNNQGQAFIVDFGIAKILTDASNLTGTSTTVGTPSYMPPEQWSVDNLTPAADQYALAVVTYQLVAGRLPFEADSVPSLWYKIEKEDATPLHIIRPDVSPSLMVVIARALAKTPSERFPNCTQFAQAFASAINGVSDDPAGDYFTFDLARTPSASVPPFVTPSATKPIVSDALPDTPTIRPPVQPTLTLPDARPPASQPKAVYIVGLAALLLVAVLAVLFLNNAGGDTAAELTLTAVNQTLIAAGLATDDQATQNREAEETASIEPDAAAATSETLPPVETSAPPATATGEAGLPTDQAVPTEQSAEPVAATPAPAVLLSPAPTEMILPTEPPAATETPPPAASPITPENTGTAIAIFNATQQAIFDATITGPGPDTNNGGTPAMFAPTEEAAAVVPTDAPPQPTATVVPPTEAPTEPPTAEPTVAPTEAPTEPPTVEPTAEPTLAPTAEPATATPEPAATLPDATVPVLQAGALNADWTPVEQEFDGVPMVLVPAGCFRMGSADGEPDELEPHDVCIAAPFWLDATEVTQGQFAALGGTASRPPAFTGDRLPVDQISWFEARDFCAARGGRLPTEAEWEFAARGPEGWQYPWGDEFSGDNAVYAENSGGTTNEAGRLTVGASWVGARDMAGNVWEWTSSAYKPYPYDAEDGREIDLGRQTDLERVVRGGSWKTPGTDLRGANRLDVFPVNTVDHIGFRCVRDDAAP
jgi:serine/threonine-protein kinase